MAKRGLGKGLAAFIDEDNLLITNSSEGVLLLKIKNIDPNPNQPRKNFNQDNIKALAESIKAHGIISPIVVTKKNDRYEIVAGERRWRAAKEAGIEEIPAIIRDYTEENLREVALIENIQREDLNPIEEAFAYKNLMDNYNLTQEEMSKRLGKSRSKIANTVRLLSLDKKIQDYLIKGEISEGHARCLLGVQDSVVREFIADRIIKDSLSVRQTETLIKDINSKTKKEKTEKKPDQTSIEIERIRNYIQTKLGTKVQIRHGDKKGKIEIEYYGNRDLDRLLTLLNLSWD